MAVIKFYRKYGAREGTDEIDRQSGRKTHVIPWIAITDSATDTEQTVLAAAPAAGSPHPTAYRSYLRHRSAKQSIDNACVWDVVLTYSSDFQQSENPLADPAEINWSTEMFQRPYEKDKDGYGIVNAAGDPLIPRLQGDDARWVVNVRKNVDAVPSWVLNYRNVVNSSAFVIDGISVAARCAKMSRVEIPPWQQRNDIWYRVFSFAMQLDGDTWDKNPLNQGMRQKDPANSNARIDCYTSWGVRATVPMALNANGYQIVEPTNTSVVYLNFKIYKEQDFNALPLV
jgi:hypothetical protein